MVEVVLWDGAAEDGRAPREEVCVLGFGLLFGGGGLEGSHI